MINITLACDNNYANLAIVAMTSVMIHNNEPIKFYLLSNNLDYKYISKMNKICSEYNSQLEIIDCKEMIEKLKSIGLNSQGRYNSFSAYLRLFAIDWIQDDIDKLLYIDCDVTCEGSLNGLFSTDMNGHVVAAVLDMLPSLHRPYIGFKEEDKYFNSGVLMFDVKQWKEKKCSKKVMDLLNSSGSVFPCHDQDLINVVFKNEILVLPPEYMVVYPTYEWGEKIIRNYLGVKCHYSDIELQAALNKPILIHHLDSIEGRAWESNSNKNAKGNIYWINNMSFAYTNFDDTTFPEWKVPLTFKTKIKKFFYNHLFNIFLIFYKKRRNKFVLNRCISCSEKEV